MNRDEIEQAMHDAGLMMGRTMVHRLRTGETVMLMFAGVRKQRNAVRLTLDKTGRARREEVTAGIEKLKVAA